MVENQKTGFPKGQMAKRPVKVKYLTYFHKTFGDRV